MREGAHVAVMKGFHDGTLASGGFTSVWTKHRMNAVSVRCNSCGKMNRDPDPSRTCSCGAKLTDPRPFW
jgi:hypothetical protein